MRALLLSAGKGTRLGNLSKNTPKCLIKINKITLIEQWINKLLEEGVTNILVNTHHQHLKIKKFLRKKNYRIKITTTYEKNLLGGYGTMYKNKKFFGKKNFLVIHSDNYFEGNLKKFILFCKKNSSYKTNILAFKTSDYRNTGILKIDRRHILKRIYEKNNKKKGEWANAAVYYFSKDIWNDLKKENTKFDLAKDLLKRYYGKAKVFKTNHYFADIGIKKNLKKLNYEI